MPNTFIAIHFSVLLIASGAAIAAGAPQPATASPAPAASAAQPAPKAPRAKLVDINSAGITELKTLPGIGDAEARRIVAGRPYLTKSHLVAKKVLDLAAYDALRDRIVAVQPQQPRPKPKS